MTKIVDDKHFWVIISIDNNGNLKDIIKPAAIEE